MKTVRILLIIASIGVGIVLLAAMTFEPREYTLFPDGSDYGKAIEEVRAFGEQGRFTVYGWVPDEEGSKDRKRIEFNGTRWVSTYSAFLYYDKQGNYESKEITFRMTLLGKAVLVLLVLMMAGLILDLRQKPVSEPRMRFGKQAGFVVLFVLANYVRVLLSFALDWPAAARLEQMCAYPFLWIPLPVWVGVGAVFMATTVGSLVTGYLFGVLFTRFAWVRRMHPVPFALLPIAVAFILGWLPDGVSAIWTGGGSAEIRVAKEFPSSFTNSEDRDYPDRPVFLILPGKGPNHDRSVSFSESLWNAIYPVVSQSNVISGGGTVSYGDLSVSYRPGTSDECIGGNLNSLTQAFGHGSWWRKLENGYLVCFDDQASSDVDFAPADRVIPAFTLLSPNLQRSCAFLQELFQTRILVSGTRMVPTVERIEPFPDRNRERKVFHFSTSESMRAKDIIRKLASFHGSVPVEETNGVTLAGPSSADMARIADSTIDRLRGSHKYPEPVLYGMPKQALTELSKYLDDPDENLVQTLLEAMISRHASADSSKLLAILDGRPDFQVDTREMAAYLLASMGDERALHHMTSLRSDPYSVRETILAVSWIRTPRGSN